jgi:hypothetical protein
MVTNMVVIALFGVKYSSKEHPRSLERQCHDSYSWLRTCAIKHKQGTSCVIADFNHDVNEIFALLGCHTAKNGPSTGMLDP